MFWVWDGCSYRGGIVGCEVLFLLICLGNDYECDEVWICFLCFCLDLKRLEYDSGVYL